ncbi:MAG: DUF6171 family protein [Bacteroides sp.]|nr:DUF6171 family protein [Roseburia sp.]MCM1461209.1 DUF6171 family protein [Bacteroides sp.]
MKKPCRKCLLAMYDPEGALRTIREMIEVIPSEKRADEAEYRRRLSICARCGELNAGVCGRCGCYVELRAAKKEQGCPHERHFWEV